jgi:hypothetical protein
MADDDTMVGQTGGSEPVVPSTEPINIDHDPVVADPEETDTPTSSSYLTCVRAQLTEVCLTSMKLSLV